jgi:hypothetical protein
MNDLRRILTWLATIAVLVVGIWGLHLDELSAARPNAPEHRTFRLQNRVVLFGREYHIPLARMLLAWSAIGLAAAILWPLATDERSRRLLGRWERPPCGRVKGGAAR